jgi:hypothetical protein
MDGVLETMGIATFDWNEQTWTLPRPNGSAEGMIRTYLQHRERYWVQVQFEYDHPDFPKGKMGIAEYSFHMEGWRASNVKGKWAFRKPDWAQAMENDTDCFAEMVYLCLTQVTKQAEVSRAEVRKMVKDKQEDCDRKREEAFKAGMEPEKIYATINSEIMEAFRGLLAPTPSIAPTVTVGAKR